eukprot:g1753.t1
MGERTSQRVSRLRRVRESEMSDEDVLEDDMPVDYPI